MPLLGIKKIVQRKILHFKNNTLKQHVVFLYIYKTMQSQEFKVTLIGHTKTGKTTFVSNLLYGDLHNLPPTLGVDVKPFGFKYGDCKYRIMFWDCAGDPRFLGLGQKYVVGSDIVLIFTDPNRDDNDVFLEWVPHDTPYEYVSRGTSTTDILTIIKNKFVAYV